MKHYKDDYVKDWWGGGVCGVQQGEEKYVQSFGEESCKKETIWKT